MSRRLPRSAAPTPPLPGRRPGAGAAAAESDVVPLIRRDERDNVTLGEPRLGESDAAAVILRDERDNVTLGEPRLGESDVAAAIRRGHPATTSTDRATSDVA